MTIHFGTAWYPEHWDEARWSIDLALMRAAHMNVVRVAEFAWSRLEPREGVFEFDWLERAVNLAQAHALRVVIGTPSAAPPAWLTQQYPETLATRADGLKATHGARAHYSPTNPTYRQFAARIAEQLAARFGQHPNVIGWQIDNEYHSLSFDAEARSQFQTWLREKYRTLDALNTRWSTTYWSQEYSDWAQIPLPGYPVWGASNGYPGIHHPALMLEVRRFFSEVYRDYQHHQIAAIRRHAAAHQWITHNFFGFFEAFDQRVVAQELDFAAWDNYVGQGHLNQLANGMMHDLMRGHTGSAHWVMETQPGTVNWARINNALAPGEMRGMAWHAVAHGAEAVLYWQWRSAPNNQEQYHGTLIAQDGTPRPHYAEAGRTGGEFATLAPIITGERLPARCALLFAVENHWAINYQRHHVDFDPWGHLQSYYMPFQRRYGAVDVIHPLTDLSAYPLVLAPHLHLQSPELVNHLNHYVENGGHLILGARSGMKSEDGALLPQRQPGGLQALAGARVEDFYALEAPVRVTGSLGSGGAQIWGEWIEPTAYDVDVLLRYQDAGGWLDGHSAAVTRAVGSGHITVIGAWLDAALMDQLAAWAGAGLPDDRLVDALPAEIEWCLHRKDAQSPLHFLINHSGESHLLTGLKSSLRDLLSGTVYNGSITLRPRAVLVLQ
ncbi:MAG: beta-galactosidase [Anaerolinea sp.]|nr:beta-galactosidase [Anaerolinea sp.]